jgi:hypothetical protein
VSHCVFLSSLFIPTATASYPVPLPQFLNGLPATILALLVATNDSFQNIDINISVSKSLQSLPPIILGIHLNFLEHHSEPFSLFSVSPPTPSFPLPYVNDLLFPGPLVFHFGLLPLHEIVSTHFSCCQYPIPSHSLEPNSKHSFSSKIYFFPLSGSHSTLYIFFTLYIFI